MSNRMPRAAIYARLSDDEGGKADSIPVQVRRCREYAERLGFDVVAVLDKDNGVSGGIAPHLRPSGRELYALRDTKQIDVVVMRDADRFYRSDRLAAEMRKWERAGVQLLFTNGALEAKSRAQRNLQAGITGVFGQHYRETIGESTHGALADRVRRKSWVTGAPYGYTIAQEGDRKVLVIEKEQARTVRGIFKAWADDGKSCSAIAHELNADKVPSPGSRWTGRVTRRRSGWINTAVRAILLNRVYVGHVQWNRSRWSLNEDTGKHDHKARPKAEILSYHEEAYRLVPDALFDKAQKRFRSVASSDPRHRTGGKSVYRLSGLLRCGACGFSYVMDGGTHYSCASAKAKLCTNKLRIRRDWLEHHVIGSVDRMLRDPEMVADMAKELRRVYNARAKDKRATAQEATGERAELEARIKRLKKRLRDGDPDMAADEIQAAIDRQEAKLKELVAKPKGQDDFDKLAVLLPKAADNYLKMVDAGLSRRPEAVAKARDVLRLLVGGEVGLHPIKASKARPAHLEARFTLGRVALLPVMSLPVGSVVAGAGFEPATFGL